MKRDKIQAVGRYDNNKELLNWSAHEDDQERRNSICNSQTVFFVEWLTQVKVGRKINGDETFRYACILMC